MSFLDDVFGHDGFIGKLGETLQDVGWTIGAPIATAVDLARSGFDKDITFGGALSKGINRGTQLFLGDNGGTPDNPNDDRQNLISPGVHKAMDALEWVYREAVTPAASMQAMTGQRVLANIEGVQDNKNPLDLAQTWQDANNGKTSIGREQAYLWYGLLGTPIGDHRGLTDEGQKLLDEHSKSFDVLSGSFDAGNRLVLDPTIVLGKAAKLLKVTQVARGIKDTGQLEKVLNETKRFGGIFDSFGQRLEKANDWNMGLDIGRSRPAAEIYAANPGLQGAGGDGWAIANALESASKDMWAAGAKPVEISEQGKLVSLAGINDPVALANIDSRAAAAKDAVAAFKSSRDDLQRARTWALWQHTPDALATARGVADKYGFVDDVAAMGKDYFSSDEFLSLTAERLKAVGNQFTAAQAEAARTEKLKNLFTGEDSLAGALVDRPLLAGVRGSTKAMSKAAAKEGGRHEPAKLDFIFQSSPWNKAVKVAVPLSKIVAPHIYYGAKAVKMFNTTSAPRVIDMHDEQAPLALNNFLKHSAIAAEDRESLVSQMAGARTEGARNAIVNDAIGHAQASMVKKYMDEHPHFSESTAQAVISAQAKAIKWEADRLKLQTRKFTAHKADDGLPGDATIDDAGVVNYRPLLDTQLENHIVLPDLRQFTKILDRHSGWLNDMAEWAQGNRLPDQGRVKDLAAKLFDHVAEQRPGLESRVSGRLQSAMFKRWKTEQFVDGALSGLQKAWKYGVLLRPAYPMRVLIDSDLRAIAKMGPAAFGMHFAPRAFGFATMGSASRVKTAFAAHSDQVHLKVLKADIQKFEDAQKAAGLDPKLDEGYRGLVAQGTEIEKRLEVYRSGGRAGRTATYGRFGEVGQKDILTRAGNIPGAFADAYGREQRYIASTKTTAALLGDQEKVTMGALMSENWTSLTHQDPNHLESWLHAINAQLNQSDIGKAAVRIQAQHADDPEAAVRGLRQWLRTDPKGKLAQERMSWDTADADRFSREVVGYVNHYLPTPELRAKAVKEKITQQDIEAAFPDPETRPPVHGQALARAMGRGSVAGEMINDWFSRTMRWLSDAPEDQLARHPMYAAVYEQEAKRAAEFIYANPEIKTLTGEEIRRNVQVRAHKKAQKAMKDYMFDIASQSDLSHALRFYSPFIAAWEDTVRKWGRIASENPDIIGKAYLLWNSPNAMGLVVDKDGKPVAHDDFTSETYMMLRAPSWAPAIGGKELTIAGSHFRIPKQAMNIVLQGGLQPGFGPLVAIPTAKLQIANPELNDVARFINPYGPPESVWDAVAPSTVKRVTELVNGQSRAHMYDTERIYMQDLADHRLDPEHHPDPSWAKAAEKAKWVGVLKVINNSSSPFPAIFDSKYKLYQDAYRDLHNKERQDNHEQGWADDQFIKGYGQTFFPLVQSMSKNNAGVGATAEAVDALKKYSGLVSSAGMEAGDPNKALIRLIVGPEGEGAYNQSAHRWEETRQISPGSGVNFRDVSKGQEAAADADSSLGWLKYRQFMNVLDSTANSEGLRTYSESDDLVAKKAEFVANLKEQNPSWRVDYESMDPGKFTRDVEKLAEVANDKQFVDNVERTDMAGVREYLRLRQALQGQLSDFDISEGSQAAVPLKQEFTNAVMNIVSQNTQFSEFAFHTFLERDPLLEPLPTTTSNGQDQQSALTTANRWGF